MAFSSSCMQRFAYFCISLHVLSQFWIVMYFCNSSLLNSFWICFCKLHYFCCISTQTTYACVCCIYWYIFRYILHQNEAQISSNDFATYQYQHPYCNVSWYQCVNSVSATHSLVAATCVWLTRGLRISEWRLPVITTTALVCVAGSGRRIRCSVAISLTKYLRVIARMKVCCQSLAISFNGKQRQSSLRSHIKKTMQQLDVYFSQC